MAKAQADITINAPTEKVFKFLNDPNNMVEVWPSMVEVKNIKDLPNGGHSFDYVYRMVGIQIEGTSEEIELIPDQKVVNETRGGVESKMTWTFEPAGDGTKLNVDIEYTVPVPVLGKMAEAIIIKANNREIKTVLANIKDALEG